MKKLFMVLIIPLLTGCLSSEVYLPRTSRVFHAKKSCAGCNDPNPIVFQSIQNAIDNGGITPCGTCVRIPNNLDSLPPATSGSHTTAKILLEAIAGGTSDSGYNSAENKWHEFNVESELRQQTSIQRQQLELQEKQQRQLERQRLLNQPSLYEKQLRIESMKRGQPVPYDRNSLYEKQLYQDSLRN